MIRTIEKRLVLIEKQFKEFSNTININDNKELISAYNKCMRENFCIINLIRTLAKRIENIRFEFLIKCRRRTADRSGI